MATTTPNYGWDVPTSTDYVKDGATAIETLGDDIDATLYAALGGAYPGLRLIKKQTVGSAVASVTVTSVFSATYDNYKIIYSGGVGSAVGDGINLKFNNSTGSTYGHAVQFITSAGTSSGNGGFNASAGILAGLTGTLSQSVVLDVMNPNQALETTVTINSYELYTTAALSYTVVGNGIDSNSAAQTGFSFSTSPGTLTGGVIYVYGYGAS